MMSTFWDVGPGGLVAPGRVVAAGRWESMPIRRAVRQARAQGRLIDLTYGHACHWVLFLDSGHLVLATRALPVAAIDPADAPEAAKPAGGHLNADRDGSGRA